MVIGRVDTGKSTFCRHLSSAALEQRVRVGIVDADVGQSWIGPPATVGMKMAAGDPSAALFPDSLFFVGSVSPEKHLLRTAIGAKRMVEAAIAAGAELVVIDTTGLVDGQAGRALKSSKVDLIRPDHIVCFQRSSELETLIRGFEANCHVHRLEPPQGVKKKSQDSRRKYRQKQFREYFSGFVSKEFHFSQLRGQRTIFLNGRRASHGELQNLSEITEERVLYAEWSFRGLFLVTANRISGLTAKELRSHLNIRDLSANTPDSFRHLLTALLDERGEVICLSLIENVDFGRAVLVAKCKKNSAERARAMQFSHLRL